MLREQDADNAANEMAQVIDEHQNHEDEEDVQVIDEHQDHEDEEDESLETVTIQVSDGNEDNDVAPGDAT